MENPVRSRNAGQSEMNIENRTFSVQGLADSPDHVIRARDRFRRTSVGNARCRRPFVERVPTKEYVLPRLSRPVLILAVGALAAVVPAAMASARGAAHQARLAPVPHNPVASG